MCVDVGTCRKFEGRERGTVTTEAQSVAGWCIGFCVPLVTGYKLLPSPWVIVIQASIIIFDRRSSALVVFRCLSSSTSLLPFPHFKIAPSTSAPRKRDAASQPFDRLHHPFLLIFFFIIIVFSSSSSSLASFVLLIFLNSNSTYTFILLPHHIFTHTLLLVRQEVRIS